MKITDLLKKESIALDVKVDSMIRKDIRKVFWPEKPLEVRLSETELPFPMQRLPRSMNLVWQPWWCRRAWTMNHLTEALPIFCS